MQNNFQDKLKTYVVINPVAGTLRPETGRETIQSTLEAHQVTFELYETTGKETTRMAHEVKKLPYAYDAIAAKGIGAKTMEIHHSKLYAGYVNKRNEIEEKLAAIAPKDWEWLIGVNLMGVVHGIQAFLPLLQAHGEEVLFLEIGDGFMLPLFRPVGGS